MKLDKRGNGHKFLRAKWDSSLGKMDQIKFFTTEIVDGFDV